MEMPDLRKTAPIRNETTQSSRGAGSRHHTHGHVEVQSPLSRLVSGSALHSLLKGAQREETFF